MNSVVHLTLPKDSLSGSPLDEKSKNSRSLEKKRESVDMASRCVVVDDAKKTVSLLPTARFLEYREKQRQLVLQERERERQEEAAYFAENDIPAPEEDDDYDPYQEEDEAEEEECQHILSSAPRHMRFDYISISPFLQQVFKTSVEPKIKSLVEFVARTPKPVSDIHELDGSMDFDASFSIMDEVETNISENIKSETFFIYGNNTTTDKEDLFLYLVKNTALYLNEKMKGKDTVGGCHGDGSFSVMDIYEQWGSGDVLDLGDDMHGAGRACHRSQWKAMKNGMARHSTRQSTSSLVSGGSTNSKENDRNNGQDWDGLETLLRSIRAPGCLRDNPEAQEHHRHNSTLVWTFYWTTASYNPLYIPGRGNGGASTPTSLEVSGVHDDGSFVPLTGGDLYDNATFREGRLHFVLLPSANLKTQGKRTVAELHALSVALQSLSMTGGAVPPQPEEEEEGEVEAGHVEEEEEEQQQTTPVKEDTREKSASSVRRFSTPKARRESAVETEADFQCRAAIRDSPLLSYLAAVPNTPYSAALWDGNGSTCSSQVTSRSQSPATSPRRSISGAYSVCESLMSQKSVGMADLTGSKAKERLRQSLGHINLLTCLCSSWEEYLQVRTALQYLYRCLNRPLPPPTPREEALGEKSPSPLPVSDVVPDEAEAAADETAVKLTSTVNCTDTRCGTQDTMEGSAADLDGRMRSRTRNPELLAGDTDPRGEFAMRLDFSKLVLPRRGYSVPTAADAAELLKCFKGNADVAPEEEKETPPPTEEEEPVPSSEGRERVTLTPRNADLDSLFLRRWDREGKDSAMVEELKQYCAQLFAENESLRGTLSKNPLVNSPSSKFLHSCLLDGGNRARKDGAGHPYGGDSPVSPTYSTKGLYIFSPSVDTSGVQHSPERRNASTDKAEPAGDREVECLTLHLLQLGRKLFLTGDDQPAQEMETFRRLLTTLLHHHHLEEKETVYTGEEVDAVIQLRELRERLHFEKAVREETDRIMAERQGQMEAQQHRIEQQNDELGRLRLKLAEYEEKFAHLRHVLVPLVVREMDAVQSDEQGRIRRAEKERTERLEKLSDIDARLHKIRRVTEEDYVAHTDVDYVEPKPI